MKGKIIGGFLVMFTMSAAQVYGATLYMDPNNAELARGDTLKVSVRLDTDEGECVNVVDGVLSYSENIQPVDISRGASILSMWVEEPVIDTTNRTITFAGGIPNGYCGRIAGDPRLTNVVVDLLFQSPGFVIGAGSATNTAEIVFAKQTQVLLNDGKGTKAPLTAYGANIELLKNAGSSINNEWGDIVGADDINPEEFSITLARIPDEHSRYSIIFNTTDKQSGIDHYEVIEEPMVEANLFNWGREDAPWKDVKSPYQLKDQSLNSIIRVKAIDKAGNEYIAVYVPETAQRTIATETKIMVAVIAGVVGVLVMVVLLLTFITWRRRHKERKKLVEKKHEDDTIKIDDIE